MRFTVKHSSKVKYNEKYYPYSGNGPGKNTAYQVAKQLNEYGPQQARDNWEDGFASAWHTRPNPPTNNNWWCIVVDAEPVINPEHPEWGEEAY